jgi:prophage maintenance system killer protein
MTARVYYHHPEDSQYSITYVTQDRDEITASGQDTIIEQYEMDEEFFVLYTNHGASGTVEDLDDEFEAVLDEMSLQNRTITVRLLQVFEEIIEEKELEEEEAKLEIYKQIGIERIPDAIARVDWNSTAVDVAGQLMSTLILKHALPNANHRTSIGMAQWYLESIETGFSFPDFATEEYDWKTWVNEYIRESKRHLTVRRNTTAFSLLAEWGCDTVVRKNDVEIDLAEYDLDLVRSEAYSYYGDVHTKLCTDFLSESVTRAGHDELISIEGMGKSEFVSFLEAAE